MTLEALLRTTQVDAFGLLVPLTERAGLPLREVRETMAAMYLRRGYLDSAADEWISVVQDFGPDARALTGLGLVAAARDMRDDALVFARALLQPDVLVDDGYLRGDRLKQLAVARRVGRLTLLTAEQEEAAPKRSKRKSA